MICGGSMMYDVYNTHMFTSHHSVFMHTCTCILLSMLNVHYFLCLRHSWKTDFSNKCCLEMKSLLSLLFTG